MRWQGWILSMLAWGVSGVGVAQAGPLPTYAEVRDRDSASDLVFLDRRGERLGSIRRDVTERRFSWIELSRIAPLAREVLVATEDRDFFEHAGVDWFALAGNAMKVAVGARARGASTLTMQLVSLLEKGRAGRRGVGEKWDQVRAALDLEKKWNKDQILEAYLNLVPFRGEVVGIHAASWVFFGKDPGALDPVDAATLVAMLPSPNTSEAKLKDRACLFLSHVYESFPERAAEFCRYARERKLNEAPERLRTHEMQVLLRTWWGRQKDPEKVRGPVRLPLDSLLQAKVLGLARETLAKLDGRNVSDAAVLVRDLEGGEVRVWLPNVPEFTRSPFVDGVIARRQAGSTLKPFFYEEALRRRKADVHTLLEDKPEFIPTGSGSFRPENYDHQYHGQVPLSVALGSSLNIPAIEIVRRIGIEGAVKVLQHSGFGELQSGYRYGPSIALGTPDVTLEELVEAYRRLALRSRQDEPAGWITRILADRDARALTFGLGSVLNTPFYTAVKTGTSKDMRDNWCIGYSSRYVVGVWVGNFSGSPMHDVSGVSGAAPLWAKIMALLHDQETSVMPSRIAAFEIPRIQPRKIDPATRIQRILYPVNEAIFAFDPGIPVSRQKIHFRATRKDADFRWFLNGEGLSDLGSPQLWTVRRGKYQLQIRSSDGRVQDEVSFLVK
jgi:penicillin-binding protein 1C